MERRTLIPHQVDRFTIFQYPSFIEHQHSVAIVSCTPGVDSLVHDGSKTMGNDKHRGACETFLDGLGDFRIHPVRQRDSLRGDSLEINRRCRLVHD
jgi:hypothetical protein